MAATTPAPAKAIHPLMAALSSNPAAPLAVPALAEAEAAEDEEATEEAPEAREEAAEDPAVPEADCNCAIPAEA